MKLDLDREGLEMLFSPWQVEVMRLLWGAGEEVDSRTAYEYLRKSGAPMSRASIIMFLNMMAEEGFVECRDVSSKGGWKRLYRASTAGPDEESFKQLIAGRIMDKVVNEIIINREVKGS